MKKDYLSTVIFWLVGIIFLAMFYFSPYGSILLGKTYKNYYYSADKEKCLTIIVYTGSNGLDIIKYLTTEYDPSFDDKSGIYIIPGKFKGRLPKENYVRLSYIGVLDSSPIYYRWKNDSLVLRLDNWRGVLIENKLYSSVLNDSTYLECEDAWIYKNVKYENEKMAKECDSVRSQFQCVTIGELRTY